MIWTSQVTIKVTFMQPTLDACIHTTSTVEMMSNEQRADRATDGRVKGEDDEVALIVEADTGRREEAVMVSLQHAAVADLAVVRTRRRHQQTHGAVPKAG